MRNDMRQRRQTHQHPKTAAVAMSAASGGVAVVIALVLGLVLALALGAPDVALAQMPDLSQMSGRSLPSPDLPTGTVSVRVIRGAITNNVVGAEVRLEGGAHPLSVNTDGSGRAMFPNVMPGSTWLAVVTVDGERLESQPFVVPSTGGLRVILAAGVAGGKGATGAPGAGGAGAAGAGGNASAGAPAAQGQAQGQPQAAVAGDVLLGSQSRFVIELAEGSIEVYGLLNLGNTHATPIMPSQPVVFQAPDNARNLSVLEGSTGQAKADGNKVTVTGPFAPGETPLQIAYRIPYDGDTLEFAQTLPLTMRQSTVIVRKLGNVRVEMPGVRGQREARFENRTYIVVSGDRVDADHQLNIRLRGLPHRAAWPRYTALLLALGITLAGVWLAVQPDRGAQDDTDARALRVRRAGLFDQLVAVERRFQSQPDDADLRAKRESLVSEIEDLDDVLASLASEAAANAGRARTGQVAADATKAAAAAETAGEAAAPRPAVR